MTTRSTSAFVIVTASVLTSLVVGCAANEPTDSTDDARVAVDTSITPKYTPPLTGGVCPDKYSPEPAHWYQQRATSVVQYLMGGKQPITPEDVMKVPACSDAVKCTTVLHDALQPKSYATLSPATSADVCGIPAAIYGIDVSAQMPPDEWELIKGCGDLLDKCWGVGVSGFFYADPSQDKTRRIYIDPEPAKLTEDLSGSTGATAAAVYTTSGTDVKVLKWPATYTNSMYPPAAGTPCSTGDLPWGSDITKMIQGAGSFRRCY